MGNVKKIHFIAIGGSIMHNLAIALKNKGYEISGSDDEIFEPSKSKLKRLGLLPTVEGWQPEAITTAIDVIILGMHARKDNPELLKAQALGIKIYSFPEYIYEQSKDKKRVVIAGSHGKTTITSMIMHVLNYCNKDFDYAVGAALNGFENSVRLSDAPIIIIEGDEYLSSPLDMTAKFFKYHHHIGLISGIAWDHMNVFPTEAFYTEQFEKFADLTPANGFITYYKGDKKCTSAAINNKNGATSAAYEAHPSIRIDHDTFLIHDKNKIPIKVFGQHNLENISGAKTILMQLGITDEQFYAAIPSFEGANLRLDLVAENEHTTVYKDFAHAPSKVAATTSAFKKQYPDRKLVACLELHTFSSLNTDFISNYKGTLQLADIKIVYFNPHTVAAKKLPPLSISKVKIAFGEDNILVFDNRKALEKHLLEQQWENKNALLMTSGNYDNMDIPALGKKITETK
ncbi:MAG: Mur ligase domain-containing protein [Cyclobacteriaceae bacterium]|nr:Mur ligase domain-containing protein [Cyclobacteriaceae bacterium]